MKFEDLPEDEKLRKALWMAYIRCEGILLDENYLAIELREYREYIKSIVKWLREKHDVGNHLGADGVGDPCTFLEVVDDNR